MLIFGLGGQQVLERARTRFDCTHCLRNQHVNCLINLTQELVFSHVENSHSWDEVFNVFHVGIVEELSYAQEFNGRAADTVFCRAIEMLVGVTVCQNTARSSLEEGDQLVRWIHRRRIRGDKIARRFGYGRDHI